MLNTFREFEVQFQEIVFLARRLLFLHNQLTVQYVFFFQLFFQNKYFLFIFRVNPLITHVYKNKKVIFTFGLLASKAAYVFLKLRQACHSVVDCRGLPTFYSHNANIRITIESSFSRLTSTRTTKPPRSPDLSSIKNSRSTFFLTTIIKPKNCSLCVSNK